MYPITAHIASSIPSLRVVLPTAPTIPVTLNNYFPMPAWYDIEDLSDRTRQTFRGIKETSKTIFELVERERAFLKGRNQKPSNIILGGFSQGGALALYVGYSRLKEPIDSLVALSTYLPFHQEFDKLLNKKLLSQKLFWAHGNKDTMVRPEWGEKSFELLTKLGVNGEFKMYDELDHSISIEGIQDLENFVKERISLSN